MNSKFLKFKEKIICHYNAFDGHKRDGALHSKAARVSLKALENELELPPLEGGYTPYSLSHTDGLAIAATAMPAGPSSIGVDIEWCDRKLNQRTAMYILQRFQKIQQNSLTALELWTLKEASFKAISNLKGIRPKLIDIDIDLQQASFTYQNIKGEILISEEEYAGKKFYLALAWV